MYDQGRKLTNYLLLIAIVILSGCVLYPSSGRVVIEDKDTRIDVSFTDNDKYIIRNYYRHNLPPGLAKRSTLPPGLQKQLQRKGSLPPGLSAEHLPHDLEHKLSRLPEGYIRVRIETDILLMHAVTKEIFDVLKLD